MKTITLQISQNEDYILLLALLQKFTGIKVLEKKQANKRDMSKYYGCLSHKQSIEEIDNQLNANGIKILLFLRNNFNNMKDIRFDERGNLFPYELISLSLAEFKALFVEAFENDSTRYEIFERYLQFIDDFSQQISSEFTHWINGSFVSDKFNPNDIDFVTIIPIEIYEQNQTVIEKQFSLWNVKKGYGDRIDAYMVKSYPDNHKFYDAYQCDLLYWQSWFSSTRLNRAKKKFPKGFVQIQFT